MSSELTRVTPLHGLIKLSKLNRCHFELPYDNHLVITPTGKVLSIGREAHNIDSGSVSTL